LFEICDRIQVIREGRLSAALQVSQTRVEDIGRYMIGAEERAGV
jgi:ABC-type sugar transport system ATPase subunit